MHEATGQSENAASQTRTQTVTDNIPAIGTDDWFKLNAIRIAPGIRPNRIYKPGEDTIAELIEKYMT